MIHKTLFFAALLGAGLLVSGCATSRSEISLAQAAPGAAQAASNGRTIAIRTISDDRAFEVAPRDPSIPSLGTEGGGDDIRARAVGRKRNSYGRALGDVLLVEGESVTGVVRENLTTAFRQAGYQVVDASSAQPDTLIVDVSIGQFWSWFTPGAFTITLRANIETTMTIAGGASAAPITVQVERQSGAATDGAWRQVLTEAVAAYQAEAAARASQPIS